MSAASPQWIQLQNGARFVANLWASSDERQQRETLVTVLWSGNVRMRARVAVRPHDPDGRPMLLRLERNGVLGSTTPLPDIQNVLLRVDPRLQSWNIPVGRIMISPIYDDRRFWGGADWEPFFPGGATIPTGRFLTVELDDIEFDGDAARAYIVGNLLPADVAAGGAAARNSKPPPPDGNVIPFPYRTGTAGRPTSWSLIEAECRRRYGEGERHPNDRTKIESPAKWARELIAWLREAHKGAPVPKDKTLTNKLGGLLRTLEREAPQPDR